MSEIKYVTQGNSLASDANAFNITLLNPPITTGVEKFGRIGNRIKYKMLTVRLMLSLANVNGGQYYSTAVRVIVVQSRTDAPSILADVFDSPPGFNSTIIGTNVRVMYDKMYTFNPQGTATQLANGISRLNTKMHFKIRNNVTFKGGTDTIADDSKDRYYLIVLTDIVGGTSGLLNIEGNVFVRLSYYDI